MSGSGRLQLWTRCCAEDIQSDFFAFSPTDAFRLIAELLWQLINIQEETVQLWTRLMHENINWQSRTQQPFHLLLAAEYCLGSKHHKELPELPSGSSVCLSNKVCLWRQDHEQPVPPKRLKNLSCCQKYHSWTILFVAIPVLSHPAGAPSPGEKEKHHRCRWTHRSLLHRRRNCVTCSLEQIVAKETASLLTPDNPVEMQAKHNSDFCVCHNSNTILIHVFFIYKWMCALLSI